MAEEKDFLDHFPALSNEAKDYIRDKVKEISEFQHGIHMVELKILELYWEGLKNLADAAKAVQDYLSRRDPLILDLDGDGIETHSINNGTYFDHNANGFTERTAWVSSDDGLLVLDRNGDGTINNGREVFGDQTILKNGQRAANGFQALADLDGNKDGIIDANDVAYSQLRVWQDINGNGVSEGGELKTLAEHGIESLNVTSAISNITDSQGNTQTRTGSYEKMDGTTATIANVNFQHDMMNSIPSNLLNVPEDIAALPDLAGYGNLYDLHQAMARDTANQLKSLVEQFVASTDISERNSLMEQILFKWAGSDTIDPVSRGGNIDARQLAVVEKYMGENYVGAAGSNPNSTAAILLNNC